MNPQKRIGDDSATEIKNKKQRDSNAAVEADNSSEDTTFVFPFKTEMAKLCREKDWSKTKLGPTNKWPQSLRTAASICLNNRFPSLVMWGPELIQLYNEGYCDVLENRHPSALGTPCSETWWDIWDVIEPMFNQVITTGQSLFLKDYLLHIRNQDGIRAERYFTYSYSPIYIENAKVGGVLNTVTETTDKIFNERQLRTLREIASHTTEATTITDACRILASTLLTNPYDIFFASIYLGESNHLRLIETVNVEKGTDISPCEVGDSTVYTSANQAIFAKALLQVASTDTPLQFDLTSFQAPKSSVWINAPFDKDPVFTRTCKMLPIASTKHGTTMGVIVIGISPMRPYDESYSSFLRLIAGQTSAVIGNARAHEEERQKAEMLAELDRAKTLFFSNISHEFRTPITLMLGPIEDLILKEKTTEDKSLLVQLELIHRNALRLLKLVNTLLDFSRIEAGRMEATFEPADISQVTHDLASVFRSACERVGLDLIVECPPVSEMVFIDNDMYEKILLNLVSNAYKFCMRGHIAVKVKELGKQAVQISVEDTGTGIPDDEVPRLFERFHRVPESKGRTHEGTGIGLAMVNELVKLHGGTIQVYSKLGQGSIFIVTLPYGTHHLPADRVKEPNQNRKQTYVRTAEWWIGANQTAITPTTSSDISPNKSRILIVDDNADMREYLQNLLSDTYDLEVAYDGLHALELISRRLPELVLTDIMMPRMDGFGLVQKLREDQKTKTIPVIFLSARAGEEARVEGLKFGADDYLTKPFTARELLARIKTHLELYQIRQEAAIRAETANRAKDHFLAVLSHELRTPLTPALLLSESLQSDESLPEKVRLDLELITKNIKLEVKLIDDLLDVTKITKNKLVLNLEQVDAHNELQHTLNLVKHDALEKQIQFETYFNAHSYHLEADPSRLQQIFWNIVKNAVKFTPENGRIEITTRNDDMGMLRVEVKDSGIGIDTESLPKIFESFQQGAQSITNQFGGLGLGLSISRALCAMMSGTISATSDGPGCGSTFFVMFPTISIRDAPVPTPLQTTIESPIPPQHILLTEDNKSTALVMTRFLKKLGHEVKTAYCIKEALDIAANHKFDLVISDVGLPDGSGFDLMKSLHSMYGLRGICVTGYGMEDDIRRSKEVGFDIHVVKPIEIQSLQNAIAFVVKIIQSRNV